MATEQQIDCPLTPEALSDANSTLPDLMRIIHGLNEQAASMVILQQHGATDHDCLPVT